MCESSRSPILVTGSHRSGSTWVGKMIAASPATGYIQEPFHPVHSLGIFNSAVAHDYTWVSDHNGGLYEAAFRDTLEFRYDLAAGARSVASAPKLAKMLVECARSGLYRWQGRRALLKDPLALFAAEWIAARFDAQVVVLIRHPAAFVNSLIKAKWRHPFAHFLEQPRLMAEHLSPFQHEIERFAHRQHDIVDEGTLLWRITHHMIAKYRQEHPDWLFVRHEDLSNEPITQFGRIFEYLRLAYTRGVKRTIRAYTREGNPAERPGEPWPAASRLDSRKNVNRWMQRLSAGQIEQIRRQSADVWPVFYTEDDWHPGYTGCPDVVATETAISPN